MTRPKLTAALLFGGLSSEHEVSRVSAGTFADNMPADRYTVYKVGITRTGRWLLTEADTARMADGSWETLPGNLPCIVSPDRTTHGLLVFLPDGRVEPRHIDFAIPALHGLWGEDGTLQGLFELAGIPYVGCAVLASAACMDKAVANTLFEAAGIPHCPWVSYTRYQLETQPAACCDRLEQTLGYPIFVKPANAGSSVGISKALDRTGLQKAIEVALAEDDKLVFEAFVDGQEVECAALGSDNPIVTLPGEILAGDEFYTYDDKYKNGVSRTIYPAALPLEKLEQVRDLARKAYLAAGCQGLSRCDFFVEKGTGRVLINEINTFPGFTPISMWPQLMAHAGVDVPAQIDMLVRDALERGRRREELHHG